jgi:hypothetical protein
MWNASYVLLRKLLKSLQLLPRRLAPR